MRIPVSVFLVAALVGCNHSGYMMSTEVQGPIGTWNNIAVADDGMGGHTMKTTTTTTIVIQQSRFQMSAEQVIAGMGSDVTMPVMEKSGLWTAKGDTINFSPDTCKEYNASNGSMIMMDSCSSDMMWGLMMGGHSMTIRGSGMMGNDTSAMVCMRK